MRCLAQFPEDRACIIGMSSGEKLPFMGRVRLLVIDGCVSVFGYRVRASSRQFYPLFSPKCHPFLSLEGVLPDAPGDSHVYHEWPCSSSVDDRDEDDKLFGHVERFLRTHRRGRDFDIAVLLHSLSNDGLDNLQSIASIYDVFSPSHDEAAYFDGQLGVPSFYLLRHIAADSLLLLPDQWYEAYASTQSQLYSPKPPIVCALGPRNANKSTFSRFLLNSWLNDVKAVAYLDCDVGQTEFTPPGFVSLCVVNAPLLGPPFTHLKQPELMHHVGTNNPEQNPVLYFAGIHSLWMHYRKNYGTLPLIINLPGWIKSMGLDLIAQTLQLTCPTDLFLLENATGKRGFMNDFYTMLETTMFEQMSDRWWPDSLHNDKNKVTAQLSRWKPRMHHLISVSVERKSHMHSVDTRSLSLVSYFHQVGMNQQSGYSSRWDFRPLASITPYQINLQSIKLKVEDFCDELDQLRIVNGKMVSLESLDDPNKDGLSKSHGYALVRGFGLLQAHATLFLLTPLTLNQLQQRPIRLLCSSTIEVPRAMLLNGSRSGPYADVHHSLNSVGGKERKVRRDIKRKRIE